MYLGFSPIYIHRLRNNLSSDEFHFQYHGRMKSVRASAFLSIHEETLFPITFIDAAFGTWKETGTY